jgi:hypothetical protein
MNERSFTELAPQLAFTVNVVTKSPSNDDTSLFVTNEFFSVPHEGFFDVFSDAVVIIHA